MKTVRAIVGLAATAGMLLLRAFARADGEPAMPRTKAECTVVMQTRDNRLYCYATNQPFRLFLAKPEYFGHGEVLEAEGLLATNLSEPVPTLQEATVRRTGRTNLPAAIRTTAEGLLDPAVNFHRVTVAGTVIAHQWTVFQRRQIEVVFVEGHGQRFRVNVLLRLSDAANLWPVGTEVEVTGLCFVEASQSSPGLVAQVDVEDLDECRILRAKPWLTRERIWAISLTGGLVLSAGAAWMIRERRQVRRLREAERAVRQANARLEERIAQRTSELSAANDRLRGAERDLLRALDAEKELGRLRSRFVSMVSHEFRNPLGVILSSADILANYLDELPEADREDHLRAIGDSATRMARIMEDVLLVGRVDAGRMGLASKPMDLATICARLGAQAELVSGKRCPVAVRAEGCDGAVGDERLVGHILANLLSNAAKFSPPGSPVRLDVRRDGEHAVFAVSDRGIGIREADRAQLFDAFFRGANAGEIPGTGLGLVVARRCADLHRGSISFESQEGVGATFEVRLPLFPAAQTEAAS